MTRTVRVISILACLVTMPLVATASDQNTTARRSLLPLDARSAISAVLGRNISAYQAKSVRSGVAAENTRQKLAVDFTNGGVKVHHSDLRFGMAFRGYGYDDALGVLKLVAPRANTNHVEYQRGPLTEWYINGPFGLEQGFTISKAPGDAKGRPLTISLILSGDMAATVDQNRTGLTLADRRNNTELRYTGLTARDAAGKELQSWLDLKGNQLLIRVRDGDAIYPVVIDPWIQRAELTASDSTADDQFGSSVAISGNTIVVGLGWWSTKQEAYVFVKPEGGWSNMKQTATLTPSDGGGPLFADVVAIDRDTILVAGPRAHSFSGAVYIYVRPAGGWQNMTETAQLSIGTQYKYEFGWQLAISGDMVTAAATQAYVFLKPTGGWATTSTPNATLNIGPAYCSTCLVASGDTVAIGNPHDQAAYVYVKPSGGWNGNLDPTARLVSTDQAQEFGYSLAINAPADTVVVGSPGFNWGGAVYVFTKPTGGWVNETQTAKLSVRDSFGIGSSVTITGNGDAIVTGSPAATVGVNQFQGAAYLFMRPGGLWKTTNKFNAKLAGSDGVQYDSFGTALAVSGKTLVVGATGEPQVGIGKAYVFGRSK